MFKAMARDPNERFASIERFVEALRTPAQPWSAFSGSRRESVAVLPFANMSADPENEYFGDGMAEEIINALAKVQGLRVAARTSSFAFKGKNARHPRDRRAAERGRRARGKRAASRAIAFASRRSSST